MYNFYCGYMFSFKCDVYILGVAKQYGNSMFNFLKNYQTVFPSGCILHSDQQYVRIPFLHISSISLHPCHDLLLSVFLTGVMLGCVKWCTIMVFVENTVLCPSELSWYLFKKIDRLCKGLFPDSQFYSIHLQVDLYANTALF